MKSKIAAIIFILSGVVSGTANATLLVEPYLGYHDGSYETPGGTQRDIAGPSFGGRLGIDSYMFSFGADYLTGKWEDDADPSNDATPENLGIFVGYQAIPMLRFYFVYAFDTVLRLDSPNGGSSKLEGKSMKAIMGISAFSMVNINIEYLQATYDELNGNSLSGDYNLKMYGLTLSVPLSF